MLQKIFIKLIQFYQTTISPDHGVQKNIPFLGCKFHPSCSEYAIKCLETQSFLIALPKIIWRIIRCNPWSHGGFDPVTPTTNIPQ
jgi:hypothetical protein